MSMTQKILGMAALLPALAGAVLFDCPYEDPLNFMSGGVEPNSCGGPLSASSCNTKLRYECDLMYPAECYSPAGIPCGSAGSEMCDGKPDVAFPNPTFSQAAIDAVADHIADLLPRGENNAEGGPGDLILDFAETEIILDGDCELTVTFVGEGGCQRNSLGLTILPLGTNPSAIDPPARKALLENELQLDVFLPNVDFEFCQCPPGDKTAFGGICTETRPPLQRGATLKLKPDFRTDADDFEFKDGSVLSFFVIPDGFDIGFSPQPEPAGVVPTALTDFAENILFSLPQLNDPALRDLGATLPDVRQHALVFRVTDPVDVDGDMVDFSDAVFVAFEDRKRRDAPPGSAPSNEDFEDVVFFIEGTCLGPSSPTQAPVAPTFPSNICDDGLISECGNVCCAGGCGRCGGCDCGSLPGGADECCPSNILFAGMPCLLSGDVACVIDADLVCDAPGSGCTE